MLTLTVIVTLAFCFFAYVAVAGAILWMDWIEFFGKCFLASTVLVIQLLSVHTINSLITDVTSLSPEKKVFRESYFVFFFFAVQAVYEFGFILAIDTYSKKVIDGYTPSKTFMELVYCSVVILHLIAYFIFTIIL